MRNCFIPEQRSRTVNEHEDEYKGNIVCGICPENDVRGPKRESLDSVRYEDAEILEQNGDFENHDDYTLDNELNVLELRNG